MMKDILLSRTYQSTTQPTDSNKGDRAYASHALPRKIHAEVLLDAIQNATGTKRRFGPYDSAVAIPDGRTDENGFLELFGRSRRTIACECERSEETNVTMVLNLLNGGVLNGRISAPDGRVVRDVQAKKPAKDMIEEFYLATVTRLPNAKEMAAAQKLLAAAPNPQEGAEDLMWGLLNTKEFMFNH
jgi:hypothetical protein